MFRNIYGKRLLFSVRDIGTLVWTLIFPLILSTLFYFAFSGLDTAGLLDRFPLGVVDDEAFRQDVAFSTTLEAVSDEDGLFELITFASTAEADTALEGGEIAGYIIAGETPTLVVASDGINQTVAKTFLDRYLQTRNSVEYIAMTNPAALADLPAILSPVEFTEEITLSRNPPSNMLNFFYALLAMVAMYGCFQGLTTVSYFQANMSALGARRLLSPVKRWKMLIYDMLGGLTVQYACMLIVIAYMSVVLGINFGDQLVFILLTCLVGSMLGVSFGVAVSSMSKLKEGAKASILVAVSMASVFLSGLMISNLNFIIAERAPVLSWINPAARITDAFYALYFYDTYERFLINMAVVLGMTVIFFIVSAITLRRPQYESI